MNNTPKILISEQEKNQLNQKLMILLSKRVRRFSHGDSSSIPTEMADELLKSICYTLDISLEHPNEQWRVLIKNDMELALLNGFKTIKSKIAYSQKLCGTLLANLPKVTNNSMIDTLNSINSSWDAYDYQFFAHLFPCSIDYQLAIPVSETILGIDYIKRYLTHLFIENVFISHYQAKEMDTVLNLYSKDYKNLPNNLFEPIVTNALGLAVLRKYNALIMTKTDLDELYKIFENMSRPSVMECLLKASDNLMIPFSHNKKAIGDYLHRYCKDLTSRIMSMRECDGLGGIFLVSDE